MQSLAKTACIIMGSILIAVPAPEDCGDIQQQLAKKDEQIAAKDAQINDLTLSINEIKLQPERDKLLEKQHGLDQLIETGKKEIEDAKKKAAQQCGR